MINRSIPVFVLQHLIVHHAPAHHALAADSFAIRTVAVLNHLLQLGTVMSGCICFIWGSIWS
ncbi:hypothetical protein [Paenibacillus thiaminolyticus]|uniref:hypothetical protein n=1 Tax=Paenibacillus thiaminolyticus TaxID=49283 RepID=UPI0011C34B1D|nr:hypothetical protein [Paenibacillus thiaminolyticus]